MEQIYYADTFRLYALYIPLFLSMHSTYDLKKSKLMRLKVSLSL